MWLLRRWMRNPESTPEVLSPASPSVRRVEITVDRHWVTHVPVPAPESNRSQTADPASDPQEPGSPKLKVLPRSSR
jgi:hypothetical protein